MVVYGKAVVNKPAADKEPPENLLPHSLVNRQSRDLNFGRSMPALSHVTLSRL
jgi:hypothetical protein